ncbi:HPP family protein [Paraburkholderia saeva]|uniref:HPP family protein n=1 Tax=Paraburkholderia saeva TaxID=2777537 RepID=UPI001E2F7481|nr:HPP family protein [Paraburkholderia saeva]
MSTSPRLAWFARFAPAALTVRWPERLRACIGALLGIAFTGMITHFLVGPLAMIPLLVAPMGASAVLLFAVPSSPLAQPWSLIGGNLVSAMVGVFCAHWIADPVIASALAVSLAICAMFALRCVHPPSGAVALTAVLGGPVVHALGFGFVFAPIAMQSASLLCAALVWHAVTGHRYPHAAHVSTGAAAAGSESRGGVTRADLEAVINRRGELLAIDPDDLESLLHEAEMRTWARTFSATTCEDVMSKGVISISPSTTVKTATHLLTRHGIKALPVTDEARQVVGIVTRTDLSGNPTGRRRRPTESLSARWFTDTPNPDATVATVMSTEVCAVEASTPIGDLVPLFADRGHHHIPVLDAGRQLTGIITQADLIAGLYRQTQVQQRLVA